ncbi:MAG: 4-hydroxyphenylpyruvate dioxygenase, partial [Cyanobacteria bacterium J06650_10]
LNVPHTYYEDLQKRPGCPLDDLSAISQQQLLIDWHQKGDQGMLLQTFTEPIFAEPTFFFEIIERSHYQEHGKLKTAQGFGEGNFQALFEAIERAQIERGSLEN